MKKTTYLEQDDFDIVQKINILKANVQNIDMRLQMKDLSHDHAVQLKKTRKLEADELNKYMDSHPEFFV